MATTITEKSTLDINFATGNDSMGSYIWKFNDPSSSITTLTQIRQKFGFTSTGQPDPTSTGIFGALYTAGLRTYAKGEEIKTISSAQKVSTVITKEDMPE